MKTSKYENKMINQVDYNGPACPTNSINPHRWRAMVRFIYLNHIEKPCPVCGESVGKETAKRHPMAAVSHMACAMEATKHLRKSS